jgi:hypothetical protein
MYVDTAGLEAGEQAQNVVTQCLMTSAAMDSSVNVLYIGSSVHASSYSSCKLVELCTSSYAGTGQLLGGINKDKRKGIVHAHWQYTCQAVCVCADAAEQTPACSCAQHAKEWINSVLTR